MDLNSPANEKGLVRMADRRRPREEFDACALMAHVSRVPSRRGVKRVLEGLHCMEHRTGSINREGDGVGLHLDIPRELWAKRLGEMAYRADFVVAHLFVAPGQTADRLDAARDLLEGASFRILDRVLHALVADRSLSLFDAIELLFPPIPHEVDRYPAAKRQVYEALRRVWGPFAQGPAGILARWGDRAVFSTDALGLRPLWVVPTEEGLYVASERAGIPTEIMTEDPRPLAPGEKVGVVLTRGVSVRVVSYRELQDGVVERFSALESACIQPVVTSPAITLLNPESREQRLAAFAFEVDNLDYIKALADTGIEPIGSLGDDGPLAAIRPDRQTVSDFCKESVAVVTNPAMDRERETEHFSTRCTLGPRLELGSPPSAGLEMLNSAYVIEIKVGQGGGGPTVPRLDEPECVHLNAARREVDRDVRRDLGPEAVPDQRDPLAGRQGPGGEVGKDLRGQALGKGAEHLLADDREEIEERRVRVVVQGLGVRNAQVLEFGGQVLSRTAPVIGCAAGIAAVEPVDAGRSGYPPIR